MRILYITAISPPYPPNHGGRQRSNLIHRALATMGEIDLVVCGGFLVPDTESDLRDRFGLIGVVDPQLRSDYLPWRLFKSVHPKWVKRIAHNFGRREVDYRPDPKVTRWFDAHVELDKYDVIVGRYLRSLTKPGLLDRDNVILDVDDLDTGVYRSRLTTPNLKNWERWAIQNHIRQLDRIVPRQLERIPYHWIANANDRATPGLTDATVLPNIPFAFSDDPPPEPLPDDPASRRILMIGSWNHRPNTQGRDHFLREIWPEVRRRVPDAQFDIVGGGLTDTDRAQMAAVPGVNPIGFVDDIMEPYRRCAFTIAPIYHGGGTNIKVVESVALGRTCVVTPKGQLGYEQTLPAGEALMVATDAKAFTDQCVALLEDSDLRVTMAQRGRELAFRHYSFDRFCSIVHETVETAARSRRSPSSMPRPEVDRTIEDPADRAQDGDAHEQGRI